MNLHKLRHRLAVSLVGTTVGVLGCSHAGSNRLNGTTANVPGPRADAVVYQNDPNATLLPNAAMQPAVIEQASPAPLATQPETVQPVAMQPVAMQPAAMQPVAMQPVAMQPAEVRADQGVPSLPAGVTQDNPEVIQAGTVTGVSRAADPVGAAQLINRAALNPEDSFHDRQNPAPRRAYVDLTAQPWFSHAADYSWLAGEVHFRKSETSWRLRYASLDESDPYDGEVTLTDYPHTIYLKEGQYVRVNGYLVNPAKKELGAPYKVTSMVPVDKNGDTLAVEQKSGETNASLSR